VTIRIGITGHRVLARPERIEEAIRQVLVRIVTDCPDNDFEVISALAEGADCLFAKIALDQLHTKLEVRLPLPEVEYQKTFTSPAAWKLSKQLLSLAYKISQENTFSRPEIAYLATGKYVLNTCNILVAIWDGNTAQGRGGTGEIAILARRYDWPMAWIKAGNRLEGTLLPVDMGEQQGMIVYERFPVYR